ncbi:TPA: ATP-dependent endonuclease [Pseudomonas aeruginosa]|nr:ATP-binding protein [Pseudomonas aeruginosa]
MSAPKEVTSRDHWRRFTTISCPANIENIEFVSGSLFNGLSIKLARNPNVFIGKNGAGKSNLIRAIYNCLLNEDSNRIQFSAPLAMSSEIQIKLSLKDTPEELIITHPKTAEQESANHGITAFMFDPCTLIPLLQDLLASQTNLEELIEQHGKQAATKNELDLINYLTNSNYKNLSTSTIEEEFENYPALPYFEVESDGAIYNSTSMGMGELSLFYFSWLVDYMKKVDGHKILLIEEPESFLPPASQERLANIIAKTSAENLISVIISTHSEHILRNIPRKHIHSILRTSDGIRSFSMEHGGYPLHYSLGLNPPKIGILFLEDICGIIFSKCLLSKSPELSPESFYFHKSGGESEITADLKRFSDKRNGLWVAGLYDGDCQKSIEKSSLQENRYFFLPGDVAPDELIKQYYIGLTDKEISARIHIPEARLAEARAAAAGSNYHDYFFIIAHTIGWDYNRTLSTVFDMWIEDNPKETIKFLSIISRMTN